LTSWFFFSVQPTFYSIRTTRYQNLPLLFFSNPGSGRRCSQVFNFLTSTLFAFFLKPLTQVDNHDSSEASFFKKLRRLFRFCRFISRPAQSSSPNLSLFPFVVRDIGSGPWIPHALFFPIHFWEWLFFYRRTFLTLGTFSSETLSVFHNAEMFSPGIFWQPDIKFLSRLISFF